MRGAGGGSGVVCGDGRIVRVRWGQNAGVPAAVREVHSMVLCEVGYLSTWEVV